MLPIVKGSIAEQSRQGLRPGAAEKQSLNGGDRDVGVLAAEVLDVLPRTMRSIRAHLRAAGEPELSVMQLRTLLYVRRRPGVGLSGLAEHVGLSMPAASAAVDRLVRSSLLDRAGDPEERRRIRLHLTDHGRDRVALAEESVRMWLSEQLSGVSERQRGELARGLEVLSRLTGESEGLQ
jgi:DNA-binding MarR family transcriptional regulator